MSVRLTLCVVLAAALAGCASYESRYDEQIVYRDGSYYVPGDENRGDYYYAPEREDELRYGYLPYAPYDPAFGYAGFDGYCSVAYAGCVPWWAGSYLDPRFRFSLGIGWGGGYWPGYGGYWGYGTPPPYWRDHDHWDRREHRDPPRASAPRPPPPAARPVPDMARPAPVERMPRPVFGDRRWPPRPEPLPPPDEPQARPPPAAGNGPAPPVRERPRWREIGPEPAPVASPRAYPERPIETERRESSPAETSPPPARARRLRGQPPA